MINWNRLFPPLRQRRNVNYQDGPRSEQRVTPPPEVSEEQVQAPRAQWSLLCSLDALGQQERKARFGSLEVVG